MTSLVSNDFEARVTNIINNKLIELTAKGYSTKQSQAAVKRSRQWALRMSSMLSEHIQEQAFIDYFTKSLSEAETWIERYKSSMKSGA